MDPDGNESPAGWVGMPPNPGTAGPIYAEQSVTAGGPAPQFIAPHSNAGTAAPVYAEQSVTVAGQAPQFIAPPSNAGTAAPVYAGQSLNAAGPAPQFTAPPRNNLSAMLTAQIQAAASMAPQLMAQPGLGYLPQFQLPPQAPVPQPEPPAAESSDTESPPALQEPAPTPLPAESPGRPAPWEALYKAPPPPLTVHRLTQLGDLDEWATGVRRALTLYGLHEFIERPVPAPTAGGPRAVAAWEGAQAAACLLIHNSVGHPAVKTFLAAMGQDAREDRAYEAFHGVIVAVRDLNRLVAPSLAARLRGKYTPGTSLAKHVAALIYVRKRLAMADEDEESHLDMALTGISEAFAPEAGVWRQWLENGELTWDRLIQDLLIMADEQSLAHNSKFKLF